MPVTSIQLLPLSNADRALVDELVPELLHVLKVPVNVENADMNLEPFWDHVRDQYNSTGILCSLKERMLRSPGHRDVKLLAITGNDLFIPILTFVFGEAELFGTIAITSYHRLQNELYGLKPDPSLLLHRLRKESLHELGHTFGLVHCHSQECVMRSSTNVEEIDLKGNSFCAQCGNLITAHRKSDHQ